MKAFTILMLACCIAQVSMGQIDNFTSSEYFSPKLESTDPNWPECDMAKASLHFTSENEGHLHIDRFDKDLEYNFMLINRYSNDTIIFDLSYDNIKTEEPLRDYYGMIQVVCSDKLKSRWNKISFKDEHGDTRSLGKCYSSNFHYYHSTAQNQLFLTFMTSESYPHNYVYSANNNLNEHIFIRVKWDLANGSTITEEYFSTDVVSTFINPTSTDPYIYLFDAPVNATLNAVEVGSGSVNNCVWLGHSSNCSIQTTHTCAYSNTISNYVDQGNLPNAYIDVTQFFCGQNDMDYSTLCELSSQLQGEIINNDLTLSFNGLLQSEFQQQLTLTEVTKIDISVIGFNANSSQEQSITMWDDGMTTFNIENWSGSIPNFGNYTSFQVQFELHDSKGDFVSCNSYSELQILMSTQFCEIVGLLNEKATTSTKINFSFHDPDDPNYLNDGLSALGLTKTEAKSIIESATSSIDFQLSYSNGAAYQQITETVNIQSGFDLETFELSYSVDAVTPFSGSLSIDYLDINNNTQSCLISPLEIEYEEGEIDLDEFPTIDCNTVPADFSNLSQVRKDSVNEGSVVKINGFPLLILDIATGSNSTSINGEGIIPLPFDDKQLFVDLYNIVVNEDGYVIQGYAKGKNGPGIGAFPDFNLPPLYLGGEICVPPPTNGGLDGDGIDPATGLTGYGFNPDTGLHYLTGTEYDPNGYDADGNHIDTGKPWNESGCTRDGEQYAPNPETGEMENTYEPCDPTGGNADPVALDSFINAVKPLLSDSLLAVYNEKKDELALELQSKSTSCDSMKSLLLTDDYINHPMAYGENNKLINFDMIIHFNQEPKPFQPLGNRTAKHVNTENLHIDLYACNQSFVNINQKLIKFELYSGKLDTDIRNYIDQKIEELSQNEFEELQDWTKFKIWLLNTLLEYVSEDSGVDYSSVESPGDHHHLNLDLDDNPFLEESRYYNALASNTPDIITTSSSKLKALDFEYEQGFSEVMGYPRPIVTEALRKFQLASGANNIASLLPLNIDKSTARFDITILISNITIFPQSATMDIAAVVTDKDNNNQKLAFGSENMPLNAGVMSEETSRLALLNDVGIRLNNAARLFLNSGPNGTYLKWDCDGFAGLYIDGSVQFCREYILPLDTNLVVIENESVLYELDIDYFFNDFLDFSFEVNASPFELTTMPGYKWELGMLGIDMTESPINHETPLNIPADYNSKFFDSQTLTLDPLWKGFYAQNLKVRLPEDLFGDTSNTYSVEVNSLIIDDTGLTSHITIGSDPGVVPWEDGNANGWQLSIEELNLLVLQNSIAGGGFGGRIGIPVLEDPLDYDATIYKSGIIFSVSPSSTSTFTPFGATATIFKNSYVQGEYNSNGFFAKAHLNGELSFSGSTTTSISDLVLPDLTFQGLEMQNIKQDGENKLKFSPGRWGIKKSNSGSTEEDKPILSGFGISLTDLGIYSNSTQDGMFLRVGIDADIIKETLTAGGSIELHGRQDSTSSIFKIGYEGLKINELYVDGSIKGFLKVQGQVEWYDDTNYGNHFGKGFRGGLTAELQQLFPGLGVTSAAQFGTKNDHSYYFVDVAVSLGKALTLGPVTFEQFGGGISSGMYPDYSMVNPVPEILDASQVREAPLGTTLTGIQYLPDSTRGNEYKMLTGFYCVEKDIFNGTGELIVRLTPKNSVEEIEIRAQGQFLSAPDEISFDGIASVANAIPEAVSSIDSSLVKVEDIPKPNIDAALSGFASFRFNFKEKEFVGKVAAYLNAANGVIRGKGANDALTMVDIYFGRRDWWIWVGEPTPGRRAGIYLDVGVIKAGIESYLNIGTKVPPFPGLPPRVRHLGRDLDLKDRNRASSRAFAFGASFEAYIDATKFGTGVEVGVGAGFDLMLRKYDDVLCLTQNGPEEIGLNGWYAMGQAWAFLDGKIKVFGFNVLGAGLAAIFQFQAPNPTWGIAALEVNYTFLGADKTWNGDVDFGDRCIFTTTDPNNEFGMNIIVDMQPENGVRDFGIEENVRAIFAMPLADTIPEYGFFTGDPRPLSFQINQDSTGLFNEDGPVECEVIMDEKINSILFKPKNFLTRNDSFWFVVKVDIFDNYHKHSSQSRISGFRTSGGLEIIPSNNVDYSYPSDGMTNFHLEQHPDQIGYIQLIKGQTNLFDRDFVDDEGNVEDYTIKAKFTSSLGHKFYSDITYDPINYTLRYEMPSSEFQTNTMYKLEIIRTISLEQSNQGVIGLKITPGNSSSITEDRVLYTLFFRTSLYKTFTDKFKAITTSGNIKNSGGESTVREQTDSFERYIKGKKVGYSDEGMDQFDLISNGSGVPYVYFGPIANLVDIYTLNFKSTSTENVGIYLSYDDEYWPINYNFIKEFGYGYGVVYKKQESVIDDYEISELTFSENNFNVKSGSLKMGFIGTKPGVSGLKVSYNFPDGQRQTLWDLLDDEFFSTYQLIATFNTSQINYQGVLSDDITTEVNEFMESVND
ncbi:MAG: hypothetical protein AAGA77_18670 [Bacteroidota bacterium]